MADAHAKPHHDYHLVNPSPWPIVGSIFAFLTAVGLIMSMKAMTIGGLKLGPFVLLVGFAGVLYVMAAWWHDVIHEAETGDHTRVVQLSHRYGMILFIASEVMFFVAWFWAFFDASLFTDEKNEGAEFQPADRHRLHRHDEADGGQESEDGADDRPRARIDEVIVVMRLRMGVGH